MRYPRNRGLGDSASTISYGWCVETRRSHARTIGGISARAPNSAHLLPRRGRYAPLEPHRRIISPPGGSRASRRDRPRKYLECVQTGMLLASSHSRPLTNVKASCARALSSLSHLRSLRMNTFRRVLDAEDWKGYPGEREVYETPDQKARAGILMEDVKSALFGDDVSGQSKHVDTGPPTDLTSRWPELRDVWLPTSVYQFPYRSRVPRLFRHWKVYDVYRDDCGQRYMCPRSRHAIP